MHATNLKNLTLEETRKQFAELQEHLFDLEAQMDNLRPVQNHHEHRTPTTSIAMTWLLWVTLLFAIRECAPYTFAMRDVTERKRTQTAVKASEWRGKFSRRATRKNSGSLPVFSPTRWRAS